MGRLVHRPPRTRRRVPCERPSAGRDAGRRGTLPLVPPPLLRVPCRLCGKKPAPLGGHRPMKFRFGVTLPGLPTAEEWTGWARQAEDLGYDIALIPDHFGEQLAPAPGPNGGRLRHHHLARGDAGARQRLPPPGHGRQGSRHAGRALERAVRVGIGRWLDGLGLPALWHAIRPAGHQSEPAGREHRRD